MRSRPAGRCFFLNEQYHPFASALEAAEDGDIVVLHGNFDFSEPVEIDKSIFNNFSRLEDTSFTFSKDNDFKLFDLELSTEDAIQIKNDSKKAIRQIHFPEDFKLFESARKRLVFEELLTMQLLIIRH